MSAPNTFASWLKNHPAAAVFAGAVTIAGGVATILNAFQWNAYRVPVLLGVFFLIGAVYCVWLRRRAAVLALVPIVIVGGFSVYRTIPRAPTYTAEVAQMLDNVEKLRAAMNDNTDNKQTFYQNYQTARQEFGYGFWTNPTVALQLRVATVASQNDVLGRIIGEPLVPAVLLESKDTALRTVVGHFLRVDSLGQKIARAKENRGQRLFADEKALNEQISRYYELVLYGPKTYLTDPQLSKDGFARLEAAEKRLAEWVNQ